MNHFKKSKAEVCRVIFFMSKILCELCIANACIVLFNYRLVNLVRKSALVV